MEDQIDNFFSELTTVRKNLIRIPEIKYTGIEIKNVINGLMSNLTQLKKESINHWTWKQINRNYQNWNKKRKKSKETHWRIRELWDNIKYTALNLESKKEEKKERMDKTNIWRKNVQEFSKIRVKYQTTRDSRSSRRKSWKQPEKDTLPIKEQW